MATLGAIELRAELALDSIVVAVCQAPPVKRLATTSLVVPLICTNATTACPASLIDPTGIDAAPAAVSTASAAVPIQRPAAKRRAMMFPLLTHVTRPLPLALSERFAEFPAVARVVAALQVLVRPL